MSTMSLLNPSLDKLTPNDPRAPRKTATVRGKKYSYLLLEPQGSVYRGTILLVHGFPDISLAWRYQAPVLASLGLRVIIPDMLGYGDSSAPDAIEPYAMKSMCADVAELVTQVLSTSSPSTTRERIILGGHDWGGAFVWRFALWRPELVRAVFSVCTTYSPPNPRLLNVDDIIKLVPNFAYQKQFAGPEIPREVKGEGRTRGFLNALYGGRGENGEPGYSVARGVHFEVLEKMRPTSLLTGEEIDFYVRQFSKNGFRGPTNWYRTRELNFEDEKELLAQGRTRFSIPCLMVTATDDKALPPSMAAKMGTYYDDLTMRQVKASHWALWQAAEHVNEHVKEWVLGLPFPEGDTSSSSRL